MHNRTDYFVEIVDGMIPLNEIGDLIIENIVSVSISVSVETLHCNVSTNKPNRTNKTLFYDYIIGNEKSFYGISNYILNNPQKWEEDIFYA